MSDSRRRAGIAWALGLIAAGTVLRLVGLDAQSLWLDEYTSIAVSRKPIDMILLGRAFDNHTPPLYYVLLHFWFQWVPVGEFGLRLPSVLFDVANMVLLWRLGGRVLSRSGALWTLGFYALSPFMVYYAQEGRMYTMGVTLVLLLAMAMLNLVQARGVAVAGWTAAVALALAAGVYTHYYVAFIAAGMFLPALVAAWPGRARIAGLIAGGLGAVLLYLPWVPVAAGLAGSGGQSFRRFVLSVPPYSLFRFIFGYAVFPLTDEAKADLVGSILANLVPIVAVALVSLLLVLGLWKSLTRRDARPAWVLIGTLAIPTVLSLIVSLRAPMMSERYLGLAFPFFLMLLVGLQDMRRPVARVAVGGLALLMCLGIVASFTNPNYGKTPWREIATWVDEQIGDEGAIVVEPNYTRPLFLHYIQQQGNDGEHVFSYERPGMTVEEAETGLRRALAPYRRAALVTAGALQGSGYETLLPRLATEQERREFPLENGVTVSVWSLTPAATEERP